MAPKGRPSEQTVHMAGCNPSPFLRSTAGDCTAKGADIAISFPVTKKNEGSESQSTWDCGILSVLPQRGESCFSHCLEAIGGGGVSWGWLSAMPPPSQGINVASTPVFFFWRLNGKEFYWRRPWTNPNSPNCSPTLRQLVALGSPQHVLLAIPLQTCHVK